VSRRVLALATLLFTVVAPVPAAPGAVPVLVIDGKGHGHGVGMAQDGAFWMGKSGATTPQILAQFYPGTKQGKGGGTVRVVVQLAPDGHATVAFPGGGEIRDALDGEQSPGFPVRVGAGEQVALRFDGARYSVGGAGGGNAAAAAPMAIPMSFHAQVPIDPSSTTTSSTTTPPASTTTTSTTAPPESTTTTTSAEPTSSDPSSARSLWAVPAGGAATTGVPARGRQYRGVMEATAQRGPFRLVNQLDVETYLKGMGEVRNPSWPPASLRAQATAARTYALRAMAANGELCDDTRCQVYIGAQAEYAAMNKAVNDTRGQVVVFGKSLASTVYSSNGGAFSASRQEGFGLPDDAGYSYLRAAPYPTQDPSPWTVRVALTDVAARLAYRGQLSGADVTKTGPSGRAVEVTLHGSAGDKAVAGLSFAKAFSLKSTLFSLSSGTADTAPEAPPSGEGLQAPPEDAAPFDPNVLPPDPLTPDELAAVPDPSAFTAAPLRDAQVRVVPPASHHWRWLSLAGFCMVAAAAAAGVLVLSRRR
jgi:SpoIID/LytB domain protein